MIYSFMSEIVYPKNRGAAADLTNLLGVSATPRRIRTSDKIHSEFELVQVEDNSFVFHLRVACPHPSSEMNQFISDRNDLSGIR